MKAAETWRQAAWAGRLCIRCSILSLRLTGPAPVSPPQELGERESALAARESKLAAQHAELADRGAALETAKTRLEAERRQLEQREEAVQAAQAEVRAWPRGIGWARCRQPRAAPQRVRHAPS